MALAKGLEEPENFISFLGKNKVVDTDAFALLAAKEESIEKDILEVAKSNGAELTTLKDKTAVKKLWISCRKRLGNWQGGGSKPENDELPKEASIDLKAHWKALHGFTLPDGWLLSRTGQGKLWNDANALTPAITIMVPRQLRS